MEAMRRHPVLVTIAAVAAAIVLVFAGTGIAVWRAAHTDDASTVDHADAILVLGAAQYDGDPSPVFAGRLEHAQLLYDEGRSDTIVVLGGGAPGDRTTEAEAGRDWLVAQGVPAEAVVASPVGSTTLESLEAAAAWMHDRGMESAFLVSDPWHNLRVKRMASDLGLEAYASATWHSAARTEGTRVGGYLRETLAYIYYRVFGQLSDRVRPLAHLQRRLHPERLVEPTDQLVRARREVDRRGLGGERRELEVHVLSDHRERVRRLRVGVADGHDVAAADLHRRGIEQVVVERDRDVGVRAGGAGGRRGPVIPFEPP